MYVCTVRYVETTLPTARHYIRRIDCEEHVVTWLICSLCKALIGLSSIVFAWVGMHDVKEYKCTIRSTDEMTRERGVRRGKRKLR